jgi:hypothetical protein
MPADQHEFMPIAGRVGHEAVALADGTALVASFRRIPAVPVVPPLAVPLLLGPRSKVVSQCPGTSEVGVTRGESAGLVPCGRWPPASCSGSRR